MDKKLILAVAGSGKTEHILNRINLKKRTLIITYTIANQEEIKKRIIKKYNKIPENVYIFGFWQFVYRFCLIPLTQVEIKGIIYGDSYSHLPFHFKSGYFLNKYIMENKVCKYLLDKKVPYLKRIDQFFDELFIDEIQDFDSYDLMWVFSLSKLTIPVLLVGDYYQKTFSTSVSGNKAKGITKNYQSYISQFKQEGFVLDLETLKKSKRCSKNVCEFLSENVNISIASYNNHSSDVRLVEDSEEINNIMEDDNIYKLFYNGHYKYNVKSSNWGNSKGLTMPNVCVILNKNVAKEFKNNSLNNLKPKTKSKFYVACTRTSSNLLFIEQNKVPDKFKI